MATIKFKLTKDYLLQKVCVTDIAGNQAVGVMRETDEDYFVLVNENNKECVYVMANVIKIEAAE